MNPYKFADRASFAFLRDPALFTNTTFVHKGSFIQWFRAAHIQQLVFCDPEDSVLEVAQSMMIQQHSIGGVSEAFISAQTGWVLIGRRIEMMSR